MTEVQNEGVATALANAQGLQLKLLQKAGELRRPCFAKSRAPDQIEDEERALRACQWVDGRAVAQAAVKVVATDHLLRAQLLTPHTPPTHPTACPREKLNTLEKKLRIFRGLDGSRAEERVSLRTRARSG